MYYNTLLSSGLVERAKGIEYRSGKNHYKAEFDNIIVMNENYIIDIDGDFQSH